MKKVLYSFSAIIALIVLLGYQNCSQPVEGFGQSSLGFSDFAFDSKVDTLAYMSCSDLSSPDKSAYFTFKVGAFSQGGVGLVKEFYNSTSKKSPNKKIDFLLSSPAIKETGGLQLQLSIRQKSNLAIEQGGTSLVEGDDYSSIFQPVNDENILPTLTALPFGFKLKNVPGGDPANSQNKFFGSVNFFSGESLAANVRSKVQSNDVLALTYKALNAKGSAETFAVSPADFDDSDENVSRGFGIGLHMNFKKNHTAAGHVPRILSSVSEVDLLTKNNNGGAWSCSSSLEFKIVRLIDATSASSPVTCNAVLDPAIKSTDLQRVRSILPEDKWFVDMVNRCIVPKGNVAGKCYGNNTDIEYNNASCGSGTGASKTCVNYLSICIREN